MLIQKLLLLIARYKSMGLMAVVSVLVIASMFSVYKLGPDNALEKEADALINKELGTNINFDEIIDDIELLKKPEATKQGTVCK